MKKFTSIFLSIIFSLFCFEAFSQYMGQAERLEPVGQITAPFTTAYFSYGEKIELTQPTNIGGGQEGFLIEAKMNGKDYETAMWIETYFDSKTQFNETCLAISVSKILFENNSTQFGNLEIYIPEGTIYGVESGLINPAQTIEFEILHFDNFSAFIRPTPYQTYSKKTLKNVTITFDDAETIRQPSPALNITITPDNDPMQETVLDPKYIKIEGNQILLDLSELEEGEWLTFVPTGFIIYEYEGVDWVNTNLYMYYTVSPGMDGVTVLNPEIQCITSFYEPIELTWNYQTIKPGARGLSATVTSWGGSLNETISSNDFTFIDYQPGEDDGPSPFAEDQSGTILRLNISACEGKVSSGSLIELQLPQGIVESAEGPNPEQQIYISYYQPYEGEAELKIEDNLIYVSWPGTQQAMLMFRNNPLLIYPDGTRKELSYYSEFYEPDGSVYQYENDLTRFIIDLTKIPDLEDGEYTLVLPSCLVGIYTEFSSDMKMYTNLEQQLQFNIPYGSGDDGDDSSVEILKTEDNYRIYNLQGCEIKNVRNNDDLKKLPEGLYIINGKKIFIGK